jgi:choline dehydrogenase-like flavoprotein
MPAFALTDRQRDALRAICDAFVPALPADEDPHGFWARTASDLGVDAAIVELMGALPKAQRVELARLLDVLASPLLGLTWAGPMQPITALSQSQRETLLQRWACHPVPQLRQAFLSLKKLNGMLFYALAEPGRPNPNWPAIGYPGPVVATSAPAPGLRVLRPEGDVTLTCDTVVVGSGAGGGVVAGELAEAGEEVIILEKGPYVDRDAFEGYEARAMQRMYEQQGALATADGAVGVLAGACVGGGTTINWSGSFRTPEDVLRQWAETHALPDMLGPELQSSFAAVERALSVSTEGGWHNRPNRALIEGCRKLGLEVADIPRNVRCPENDEAWRAIGFGCFGDGSGAKQGMIDTYLLRASDHGARLLADTEAERILIQSGRATGVEAVYRPAGGRAVRVTVRARRVVVATGALHTPALLMRSGIAHPHLGRHLYLHPTAAVAALYPEPMDPWHGPMMSAVCSAFTHLDGTYGVRIETPPVHPGLAGMALPWQSGRQHKEAMSRMRHLGATIVLTRDRDGGHVTTDAAGRAVLHYRLSRYDRAHVLRGIVEAARIHLAAGAEAVHFPHNRAPVLERGADTETFLAAVARWGWARNRFPLFSAHQMGTCRMGGDAALHPLTPEGQVRGVGGLYVADASVFPESSGANPMLAIQALAHRTAQRLKATGTATRRPTTTAA